MRLAPPRGLAAIILLGLLALPTRGRAEFINFESGQTRPLALSPDGNRLFAVNTPDARLSVFDITRRGLRRVAEIPVGLEPVAVAARKSRDGGTQVWVVNQLSDNVSIVEIDSRDVRRSRVVGSLNVGDEPRDIVFARGRAFVNSARRGQNLPVDLSPELTTPGLARALVWVFDAADPFADTERDADAAPSPLGGEPVTIIELFGDVPRALAVDPDGSRVYAAIFHSGNETTVVHPYAVATNGGLPQPPRDSPYFDPQYDPTDSLRDRFPTTGLIVKFDRVDERFEDASGRDWSEAVRLSLPDEDVFVIDAAANPPTLLSAETSTRVGTTLYNMAVRPGSSAVFVSNTEARNHVRFEPALRGHIAESRVTVLVDGEARPVQLNPHIDYSVPTGPPAEIEASLSIPTELVFSGDGRTVYLAGFGSGHVGIFDAAALEQGIVRRELLPLGGGPSGLVLDEARDRLYVLKRFEQRIAVVSNVSDRKKRRLSADVPLGFDPSPQSVLRGRRFLYETRRSGHGDSACATCHVFGDLDGLGWDLGDPYGEIVANPNGFLKSESPPAFHPMKGPMTTQSLRGLEDQGPMHWRGDRSGGLEPRGAPRDAKAAFRQFNGAFASLLGANERLSEDDMQAFADFALRISYPPSPIRQLSDEDSPSEARGRALWGSICRKCHFGQRGDANQKSLDFRAVFGAIPDAPASLGVAAVKVPHLRNAYQKVGMFGQSATGLEGFGKGIPATRQLGDQVRGFGFHHDGSIGDASGRDPNLGLSKTEEDDLAAIVFATRTGLAPSVGQQLVANRSTLDDGATLARRDLFVRAAYTRKCDLVVTTVLAGELRGGIFLYGGVFLDRAADPAELLEDFWSRAAVEGSEQLWTCVPPRAGPRMAIDRDQDAVLDGDERDAGTNPGDGLDHPGRAPIVRIGGTLEIRSRPRYRLDFRATGDRRVRPPRHGSSGDPTIEGATLWIYNASGTGESVRIFLPAKSWRRTKYGYQFRDPRSDAPVSRVSLRRGSIRIRASESIGYSLDEPRQGRIALRLTLGVAVQWCAETGARLQGRARRAADRPGRFLGEGSAVAPDSCPQVPDAPRIRAL
jgi:DNA-binding beta-propeller fold protein YncE